MEKGNVEWKNPGKKAETITLYLLSLRKMFLKLLTKQPAAGKALNFFSCKNLSQYPICFHVPCALRTLSNA